ncbi:hypothetical protein HK097_006646 [Rhizophlyctis rosea]|uniref:Uncharacterized protein n=1 Tax=Rhizophlyctis rosea TaxID=64517 RepID=A0AAD5X6D9_9FUNG|nr:hypothetical protein HK097_006646 [Rhizophlyctis rosea]
MDGDSVSVSINGQSQALSAPTPSIPFYTGVATVPDGDISYQYVVDGKPEAFTRILPATSNITFNDLYGRSISYKPLPPFPNPLPNRPKWTRESPLLPLYDYAYVPVLHFTTDPGQLTQFNNMSIPYVTTTFTIFYANGAQTFQNVVVALHQDEPIYEAKRALSIGLTGADSINGRKYFKLRDLAREPTQMREVTYGGMLHACGLVTPNQIHVRVYINKIPYGLFAMTDYTRVKNGIQGNTREGFAASAFFNGSPPAPIIDWFEGSGNFAYLGDDPAAYKQYESRNDLSPTVKDLIPSLKLLANINGTQEGADAFAQTWDIDQIFISMIFEYLCESWDGYWSNSRNYAFYLDPVTNKWFYITQDFDYTFSMYSRGDTPNSTYQVWENNQARPLIPKDPPTTMPLINNLLAVPSYRKRFEDTLVAIVKYLYNPVAFNQRVLAHAERLAEEIKWDLSNPRLMPGNPNRWTYEQFLSGVNGTGATGGAKYSLTRYVQARAETVAKQFNFQWNPVAQDAPAVPPITGAAPPPSNDPVTGGRSIDDQPVRKAATSGAVSKGLVQMLMAGVVGLSAVFIVYV